MKRDQSGVALSGLIFWGIVISLVAILAMKVAPTAIEYYKIVKATKAVVAQTGEGSSVADVRKAYDRFANIDMIESIQGSDLDISKDGGRIVIQFSYEKRIHLFGNVSLLIDYSGSTAD